MPRRRARHARRPRRLLSTVRVAARYLRLLAWAKIAHSLGAELIDSERAWRSVNEQIDLLAAEYGLQV